MGIKKLIGGGGKSRGCRYDPETGQVECFKKQKHKDGTETTLAHIQLMHDGQCNAIPIDMSEEEEGELDSLQKFAFAYTKSKCLKQTKPVDY